MVARALPNRGQMAPREGHDGPKTEKTDRPNKKYPQRGRGPHVLSEKVVNMAPRLLPKSSQNRRECDAKIDRTIDASWNRFLEGF